MSVYDYKTIVDRAKTVKKNVEEKQEVGVNTRWSYYFAKSILSPKKDITQISFTEASKSTGDTFKDVKIELDNYKDMATRLAKYVNEKKTLPNFITTNNKKMNVNDYTYMFARIIVFYDKNNQLPNYAMVNSSSFTKKTTTKSTTSKSSKPSLKPYLTNTGCSGMGQCTGYYCACNSLQQGFYRLTGILVAESTIASWAGTTSSGTSHQGIETAVAKFNKKYNKKVKITWKNFSDLGVNTSVRWKTLQSYIDKGAVFCHLLYRDKYGHYEVPKKVSGDNVIVLNSLGNSCGGGTYCGYIETRSKSTQLRYMNGISQKSVAILTI